MALVARLLVGSLDQMPPPEIYNGFAVWGLIFALHALLLAVLDGRDRADLPFAWMEHIVHPRERRWSLFAIDVLLWVMFTVAIANRVIPEAVIFSNVVTLSLLWLAHTGVGFLHILLMIYAEIYDRSQTGSKRKNTAETELPVRLALADDGELTDFTDQPFKRKESRRGDDV
jgi:hypothetical protein